MIEFSDPKIHNFNNNIKKNWYVWFRATDPVTGKRKLFICKKGINKYKTKKERAQAASALRDALYFALRYNNYNPFTDVNEDPRENIILIEQIKTVLDIKKPSLKPKSHRTYREISNIFFDWLNINRLEDILPDNFTRLDARGYIDYLLKDRNFSGKTHNHHLGIIRTIFNALIERDIIKENPFKGIKKLSEVSGKNVPYNKVEKKAIIDYLYKHNRRMYYAVCFLYYCFIRRSELIGLQVSDINLKSGTITIPGHVSKNRKQESVTIPNEFEKVLREMKIDDFPGHYYIFGHKYQTCERRIIKPDSLSLTMSNINRKLGINGEKGFYSWKHTGVVDLYNATKDPYLVMKQCRHSELKITMIYLRSLGLTVDNNIRNASFRL